MDYAHLFKFILIGDSRVGKSSLLSHFIHGSFVNPPITVGVEWPSLPASRCVVVDETVIKLQVWGHPVRWPLSYFRGAAGALFVYDTSKRDTFENFPECLLDVRGSLPGMAIALVANKCDLPERAVSTEEGAAFAKRHGLLFFEASAKTGQGVNEAFTSVARDVCCRCGIVSEERKAPIVPQRKKNPCDPARCCCV